MDYNDGGVGKFETVQHFVNKVRLSVHNVSPSVKVGLNIPLIYFLNAPHDMTGIDIEGLIPLSDFFTTDFSPAQVPTNMQINGNRIANPAMTPYHTVTELIAHLEPHISAIAEAEKGFRPAIQAHGFSSQQIDDQIRALDDAGIDSWTLFNIHSNSY
jgi:hypothetical protein